MSERIRVMLHGVCLLLGGASCQSAGWALVDQLIDDDVPSISTSELADVLEGDAPPVLLDVRTSDEFEVSHLPDAIHFPPGAAISAGIRDADSVVAYCSVGVRSGYEVERLLQAGVTDVRNLEGSIFRWAIEGRPLENAAGPTEVVHPYDGRWGQLLPARLRSYEGPEVPPKP